MAKNTAAKPYDGQNYETHLVGLWIHNEEPTYRLCQAMRTKALHVQHREVAQFGDTRALYVLADMLKEHFENRRPELEGFWADLLGAALQSVDWADLAKDLLAE